MPILRKIIPACVALVAIASGIAWYYGRSRPAQRPAMTCGASGPTLFTHESLGVSVQIPAGYVMCSDTVSGNSYRDFSFYLLTDDVQDGEFSKRLRGSITVNPTSESHELDTIGEITRSIDSLPVKTRTVRHKACSTDCPPCLPPKSCEISQWCSSLCEPRSSTIFAVAGRTYRIEEWGGRQILLDGLHFNLGD